MPKQILIDKYALLAAKVGANVQPGQMVVIRTTTQTAPLTRAIVREAYKLGASKVHVLWSDEYVSRDNLLYATEENLKDMAPWEIDRYQDFVDNGACFISVVSPIPEINKDVDPAKAQRVSSNLMEKISFFRQYTMGNRGQWTIVAYSNPIWAKTVFPNLLEDEATLKLWDAIFKATYVDEETDPVENWNKHNERLAKTNKKLNDFNFKSLHFTNKLGTDLTVELVNDHIWSGGGEDSTKGVKFNPNIPTEESFTMPYKFGLNGRVYSTKPLNYQGRLISDFYLDFKDGAVVDYDCKSEKDTLTALLNTDEGSKYAGEIALVDETSPIAKMNMLFNMTLFDENASCHIALGRAYPMNIKGGLEMELDELIEKGYNYSKVHVDFMFGSPDLKIVGTKQDGEEVLVMENGHFTI